MQKLDGQSLNLEQTNLDKLKAIFPECVNIEGKVDIEKLLALFGEYEERQFEKYKFEWAGKAECLKIAQKRSTGTLRPAPDESVDFDTTKNLYLESDNLEVLKILQKSYYRRVKMIYIDPPYNTGNDFVYNDDFADPIVHYKEITSQSTKSNPETMGRFHTAWLNMMYPRLRLAANLLRDDGVIFISIDDNEVHNLRKLCDEIFGEENFIQQIIWKKRAAPPNDKTIAAVHEYILMYAKSVNALSIHRKVRSEEQLGRYKNPDNHPKGRWIPDNLMANVKGGRGVQSLYYGIINPFTGEEHFPSSNGNWRFNKEKMAKLLESNEIYFGADNKGRPKLKRFLSEVADGVPYASIFDDAGFNNSATAEINDLLGSVNVFDTPKPTKLIKLLLNLATRSEDIILDFFSGSATTAHAVMQLNAEDGGNRRFIMVQLPEQTDEKSEAYKAGYKNICEIGKERIRRAGRKVKEESESAQLQLGEQDKAPLDVGFRVFKLDSSNLKTWDTTPISQDDIEIAEQMILERMNNAVDVIKPDRTELDMVYEIMLKMGYTLDMDVEEVPVSGKMAYGVSKNEDVGNFALLIFLSDGFTPKMAEELCKMAPGTLIVAEKSFENMTVMQNVDYICGGYDIELKIV